MAKRYELTDRQWVVLRDLVPGKAGDSGRTAADNKAFVDGVLWVLRSGARWSDLPPRYGANWKSVHRRFCRWAHAGVWDRPSKAPDNEYRMIDSTIVRAHQQAASGKGGAPDQALGRARGGLSTKIHVLVDSFGRPLKIAIAPGQSHDLAPASSMIEGQQARYVLADRAYDALAFRDAIGAIGAEPVIPPNPTRKHPHAYNHARYKARNQIERLIGRMKRFRCIATRYDRRAIYFLSAVQIVAAIKWMPNVDPA